MNPWAEMGEVAATLYVLYLLSLAAQWAHRLVAAAREEAPAGAAPAMAQAEPVARDTAPYRMDEPVAVSGPEPGRYETVGGMQ